MVYLTQYFSFVLWVFLYKNYIILYRKNYENQQNGITKLLKIKDIECHVKPDYVNVLLLYLSNR